MAAGKRAQRMQQKRSDALAAAAQLFLSQGYNTTRLEQIAKAIDISTASLLRAYPDKEAILHALISRLVAVQFATVRNILGDNAEPMLVYAVKSALQLKICELSEAQRDMYVTAYTLPSTSEFIYHATSSELEHIFSRFMPDAQPSDFYELEIAAGSMMRGYMFKKCDIYFPVERKYRLFLDCCLKIFEVPEKERKDIIGRVLAMDIDTMAKRIGEETARAGLYSLDAEYLDSAVHGLAPSHT